MLSAATRRKGVAACGRGKAKAATQKVTSFAINVKWVKTVRRRGSRERGGEILGAEKEKERAGERRPGN